MPATDPITAEPRRFSLRLRPPPGIGLAAAVLVVAGVAILQQQFKGRLRASRAERFYENLRQLKTGQTRNLSLFITEDTDSLLRDIREMPEVESVSFEHTDLTDDGTQHVATLPGLRHISLYDRGRITDRGLVALHACNALERIELYGTSVTEDGVAELQRALPQATITR
jgi:hypothetical protein